MSAMIRYLDHWATTALARSGSGPAIYRGSGIEERRDRTEPIGGKRKRRKKFTCRNCGGGDRGRVAIYRPFGEVSLSLNRTVTCMVLKANDRRTSCPCHDEFCGPRSDYVRQVALATTTQQQDPARRVVWMLVTRVLI
ncbi:uncharacterized protein TNCV_1993561 [Trichonephila clavipes]|nr:uncharacterized protein TNCV_1993561 [Trichonephila clavipes]